jgi:MOSC domain-containing protein YiiM
MPKEGVFDRVLRGGTIKPQSKIEVLRTPQSSTAPGVLVEAELPAALTGINISRNESPQGERVA